MRFISANRIFNGIEFLKKDSVLILNEQGVLTEIINSNEVDSAKIEMFDGIITPGFINTHCHLELSYLKDVIPQQTGLVEFAKSMITKRSGFSENEMHTAIEKADAFMKQNGIVAVGDISNTSISFKTKQKSKIHYHTFIELIGLNPDKKETILNLGITLLNDLRKLGLSGSLAAHAPYSTSVQLIEAITNYNLKNNSPFSIHNQESEEENKFLQGKTSDFYKLFAFLKIDINWFKPNYRSSLNVYSNLLTNKKNILAHNTFTYKEDYSSAKNAFWCLCPSANLYIENTLPNYNLLLENTQQICFGTDSLASNSDLDILKEASVFYSKTNNLELTLKGLAFTGANALNIEDSFGSLIKGKNAGLNLIDEKEGELIFKKVII